MDRAISFTPQQLVAQRRRARRSRRVAFVRKLGMLAALLAVPAIAAETAFEPAVAQAPAVPPQPMGFETPGESFPGSAFYYLEDSPAEAAHHSSHQSQRTRASVTTPAANMAVKVGPAAEALVAMGNGTDIARAQECLATAIYYEAASESDAGQRAVAQVVLNRVAHGAWPATVCGVVFQGSARSTGCQFSFTCDGSLARRPSRAGWDRASRIARSALAGSVYAPVGLSTHYHTLAVNPYWAPSLARTTVIGAHVFYRWPGTAGERSAFAFRYAGGEPQPGRAASSAARNNERPQIQAEAPILQTDYSGPSAAMSVETLSESFREAQQSPSDRLPTSGAVRSEYANAGRWIQRP